MTDLNHVPARHDAINLRLEEWARWVRVKPQAWKMQPMFRFAKSNARQWEVDPQIHIEINTLAAHEIERAVSLLPDKHRTVLRWFYVYPSIHWQQVQHKLGLTKESLCEHLGGGRDMLKNRMKQKIVDTSN